MCHSPTGLLKVVGFKILLINCQEQLGVVIRLNPQSYMTGDWLSQARFPRGTRAYDPSSPTGPAYLPTLCYPLFQLPFFTFIVLNTPKPKILERGTLKEKDKRVSRSCAHRLTGSGRGK